MKNSSGVTDRASHAAAGLRDESRTDTTICATGAPAVIPASDGRVTLAIPIRIKRRSGRKLVTLPDGEVAKPRPWDCASTPIQQALARGHRWLAMLESGKVSSLKDIAKREKVDDSYVSRMVNLTNLAPDIVAAILEDRLPDNLTLFELAVDPPVLWDEQHRRFGLPRGDQSPTSACISSSER